MKMQKRINHCLMNAGFWGRPILFRSGISEEGRGEGFGDEKNNSAQSTGARSLASPPLPFCQVDEEPSGHRRSNPPCPGYTPASHSLGLSWGASLFTCTAKTQKSKTYSQRGQPSSTISLSPRLLPSMTRLHSRSPDQVSCHLK